MKKDYLILKHGYSMNDEKVEVYFLDHNGPMANWKGDGTHDNPYIVDEETAKALIEDNYDPCQELKEEIESTGGQLYGVPPFNPLANVEPFDTNEEAPEPFHGDGGTWSCCPIGPKGKEGWPSKHTQSSWVIMKVLDQFKDTQINIASESAREFLAKEIAKDLKNAGLLKED